MGTVYFAVLFEIAVVCCLFIGGLLLFVGSGCDFVCFAGFGWWFCCLRDFACFVG